MARWRSGSSSWPNGEEVIMYSGIAMGIAAEDPYDWTAKMDAMKKRSFVLVEKMKTFAKSVWMTISRVGQEDPCRVLHSLKVGFSLTLVSLLYLLEPLFKGIGQNAIWAVMTVVVVLEFTAGEQKNYDYGVVIFLLTFNLITVSSYRIHNVLKIAQERFYMIAIGCGICLLMSLIVFPNWSGQDLHNSTVSKLEGLANSIEDDEQAMHASWEPCHSRNCDRVPWQQYVKLGAVLRHFGYTVVALHGCLQTEIQTPRSVRALFKDPCIRVSIEVSKALMELADSIRRRRQCSPEILSDHLHEALQDLDTALKSQPKLFLGPNTNATTNMLDFAAATARHNSSSKDSSFGVSLSSVKTDSSALLQWKKSKRANEQAKEMAERKVLRPTLSKIAITSLDFSEALPFAAFASLLVEAVARLDLVIDEVEELGRVASFKEFSPGDDRQKTERGNGAPLAMENHLPSHGDD
ncbi:hypothetical protein DH2020_030745 [Rehmannia glutinosa]|uniref:Uncharacterized protein n=1 Tax=Rehmannia glutinosa TaxID=99300 RepID=A0ABR0VNB3_REHGL